MLRPLRWYERMLLAFLARSPRIDMLLVCQLPGGSQDRKRLAARLRHEWQVDLLEEIYKHQQ